MTVNYPLSFPVFYVLWSSNVDKHQLYCWMGRRHRKYGMQVWSREVRCMGFSWRGPAFKGAAVFMVVREYSPCCRIWVSALKLKADPSPPAEGEWRQDQLIWYLLYSNKNDFE